MRRFVILTAALLTSVSLAGEATFESVQDEFKQKALSLLSEEDASGTDFSAEIGKLANETFGAHPDLMRKEAEKRFKNLPQFPASSLTGHVEHKSWNQFPLPPVETGWVWLFYGWDPERLADMAKKTILSRQLTAEEHGRRALLNACCPDEVYRFGKGTFPRLIVDSLGDLFVIEVAMTEAGVCKPVSIKWMKKKPQTTESTPAK